MTITEADKLLDVLSTIFPYRDGQREAVNQIKEEFKTHRVVALKAPTGSGKSIINMVVARELGTAYGSTTLKILVDQYAETLLKNEAFADLARTLKGRNAYTCVYLRDDLEKGNVDLYGNIKEPKADEAPCMRPFTETYKVKGHDGVVRDTPALWSCPYLGQSYTYDNELGKVEASRKQEWISKHEEGCPYYTAKAAAELHRTAIMTLHYLFFGVTSPVVNQAININMIDARTKERLPRDWSSFYPEPVDHLTKFSKGNGWQLRNTLIIDEAHNLDDQLVDFFSLSVTERTFKDFEYGDYKAHFDYEGLRKEIAANPLGDIDELSEFSIGILKGRFNKYKKTLKDIDKVLLTDRDNETDKDKKEKLTDKVNELSKINYNNSIVEKKIGASNTSWIFQHDEERLSWKPYSAAPFTRAFFNTFENILISSATFIDIPSLLRNSGLPEDYAVVTMDSKFDPEKAPIYFDTVGRIGMKNMTLMIPEITKRVESIAQKHPNERGFVHCATYDIQREIIKAASLALKKRLVWHTRYNREDAFKDWIENGGRDSIFLSVFMGEGTDLAGDTATWQVIAKVPFLNLGDYWVQAHAKYTPGKKWTDKFGRRWYQSKAMIAIIQMCGRVVRSIDDAGKTYILDSNAKGLISTFRSQLDDWFTLRIKDNEN